MLRLLGSLFVLALTLTIVGAVAVLGVISHFGRALPDYSQLAQYEPPNTTRLYAADGKLLAEYYVENRVFIPVEAIPKQLINAFLAAEDRSFYEHKGIDPMGIGRAIVTNMRQMTGDEQNLVGGSTITQQVVKNFLLGSEKTYERKIKEAILSFRITKAFSKDRILELYLNQIYLGMGSYGVAAAALNYFNKSVDELTIEESALLASLPKAPAKFDPRKYYDRVKARRDWVIAGMQEQGYITAEQAKVAIETPIVLRQRSPDETARADFFAEEVRRELKALYGDEVLYKGGLVVRTTVDPALQAMAEKAFIDGISKYDIRHGYRGAFTRIRTTANWQEELAKLDASVLPPSWHLAAVLDTKEKVATIGLPDGSKGRIELEDAKWARRVGVEGKLGAVPSKMTEIMLPGDVVVVTAYTAPPVKEGEKEVKPEDIEGRYVLRQIPEVNGGFIAMDPHTGKVRAMVGGFSFAKTEYNRTTQAKRQPGSAFKTFVYLTALENGFSPTTIIVDGPVSLSQGAGKPAWTPQNYSNDYLGPVTLRTGLEKSRNAMTVKLALSLGIDRIIETGKRFGIYDEVARNFSIVLGAAESTLIRMTNAYAILANGGKRVKPVLIERIQDRYGKTIFRSDNRPCEGCQLGDASMNEPAAPVIADAREVVVEPQTNYQIISILNGVVERGTATRAKVLGRPLGGKTGTTNDSYDTWFIGFSPDLVAGTYVGFDRPRSLGEKETGASVALPIFVEFMGDALKNVPPKPFRVPEGIRLSRIDVETGLVAGPETAPNKVVLEAVKSETAHVMTTEPDIMPEPTEDQLYMPGTGAEPAPVGVPIYTAPRNRNREFVPTVGTGGIY